MEETRTCRFTDLQRHLIAALVYIRTGKRIGVDTIARWEAGLTQDATSRRIEDTLFDEDLGGLLANHYYRTGFVEPGGTDV